MLRAHLNNEDGCFFSLTSRGDARKESLFFLSREPQFLFVPFLMNAGLELTCLVSGVCESAVHAA